MVDVKKIIGDYEAEQKKQEDELNLKLLEERNQFIRNAMNIEAFIKKTVCPLFEDVKRQVKDAGYPCEVDKILRGIHGDDSGKEYILEIKIKASQLKNDSPFFDKSFGYIGDYKEGSVVSEVKMAAAPKKSSAHPISHYTESVIQGELEGFLMGVFSV